MNKFLVVSLFCCEEVGVGEFWIWVGEVFFFCGFVLFNLVNVVMLNLLILICDVRKLRYYCCDEIFFLGFMFFKEV